MTPALSSVPEHLEPSALNLPWDVLTGILQGVSAIDTTQMHIETIDEAKQFIASYGFDVHNLHDAGELQTMQEEAINFIERRLLDPTLDWETLGEENHPQPIPDCLHTEHCNVQTLLVIASGKSETLLLQQWACAILKVMHTLCHINNAVLFTHFDEAKEQILSRFYRAITHTDDGDVFLGQDPNDRLAIVGFEVKDEKSRDSMIIKLLAKRENVAEELFDMIGVRIITHTPAEAILAIDMLRRNKLIIFPNLIPNRSRNSLVDFEEFKTQFEAFHQDYVQGNTTLSETLNLIRSLPCDTVTDVFNPLNTASSATYHSLHLTERHLIRCRISANNEEIRFFFPYEIQILDQANYIQSLTGASAHTQYKQNQLIQARRRVLGPLWLAIKQQQRKTKSARAAKPLEPMA